MKLRNPLSTLLQDAANRLYAEPVSLNTRLREAPTDTLYTLSTTPQEFGKLKWFDDTELFATALRRLLDCARAYITMEQKYAADASRQGKLPLPE